jgi:hypothetical protein
MTVTRVDDAELLYRAIRANADEYRLEGEAVRFSINAFNDPENKPSVDRSSIRTTPADARFSATDGVAAVQAEEVRAIASVRVQHPDGAIQYRVDVRHCPVYKCESEPRDNPAHCKVECAPEITRSHYRKLKEALALLASRRGWIVPP